MRVWDATSGAELAVLRGHEDRVWSVSFRPMAGGSPAALVTGPCGCGTPRVASA
ncbi:MAG: hypothetical protein HY000_30865 [Planctomycetes bacterium]|nr:hypothetical protein [Planctomycetota bacterium]